MSNRFVFVAPAYNAEKTIERMLMSIFCQTYDNWLILIRDDMSTDGTVDKVSEVCDKQKVPWLIRGEKIFGGRGDYSENDEPSPPKVVVDVNSEKFWEVKNVLSMIRSEWVREDDIICRIDGDDFLCDLCALQDINAAYNESNCDVLWTNHRWADTWHNISKAMPEGADPYKYPWVSSHLKTFRKHLITDVPDVNFRGEDGEYIRRAGDQAIYLPVLYKAVRRVYLPTTTYYYTIKLEPETFTNEDTKFQFGEANFLRERGYVSEEK